MANNKEIPEAKSLRWVCNQIPDNLGDSNEERMLKAIKEYCKRGADKIEELAKDKEILERALRIEIRKSINQYRSDMAFDTGEFNMPWSQPCFVDNDSKEVEDTIQSLLQQAKKEIEKEASESEIQRYSV